MTHTKTFDELNLYFYPQWKEKLLETAKNIGLPKETVASCSVEQLFNMIKNHQTEMLDLSKRMIAAEPEISHAIPFFLTTLSYAKGGY